MNFLKAIFGPPSNDRFAALVMKAIRKTGEERPISYDAKNFQLVRPGGGVTNLANAYQEYCLAPRRERQNVLRRYAALGKEGEEQTFAEAKANLLPKVRDRMYWEVLRLQMQLQNGKPITSDDLPPHHSLSEHLVLELVIDFPESMRSVSHDDLKKWDVSFEQALAEAKDNLWNRSNQDFRQVAEGVYVSPWNDNHDASRIYLHDLIWQLKVKGDHVAAIPNRDVLIVTGSDDPKGLLTMAALVEEALKLPRPMIGLPMRLQDKQWVPLELPREHPAYWAMRKLALMTEADACANQKQLFEAIHDKTGQELFVASYSVAQKTDSPVCLSYAVWSEGVDTLLPHASEIALMRRKSSGFDTAVRVAWEHVPTVVGDLMEPQGMYPERYRVQRFPTPEQIAQMEALQGNAA